MVRRYWAWFLVGLLGFCSGFWMPFRWLAWLSWISGALLMDASVVFAFCAFLGRDRGNDKMPR